VLVVGADNKVQYRPVKLGPIIDGLRVVTDGLKAGETIVVSGLQRVRPGSPVTPEKVAMGERHRDQGQPETLLARNARLASNSTSPATTPAASPTTSGSGLQSHANKLALNSNTDIARPQDAATSN
jgi:hypothetical protein